MILIAKKVDIFSERNNYFVLIVYRIDDIEDNSILRRGVPGEFKSYIYIDKI